MSLVSAPHTLQITPWERRALQLLANGCTTGDVAASLGINPVEIDPLLTRLFVAMGAATRAEAIAAADRRGLLS